MNPMRAYPPSPGRQAGFAIGVLIATLVLLAAIAGTIALSSRDPAAYTARERYKTLLVSQAQLIRQKIVQCGMDYPTGNNGSANAADVTLPAADTASAIGSLTCPGSGAALFTGTDGGFVPAQLKGCNSWVFQNNKNASIAYPEIQITCLYSDGINALADFYAQFNNTVDAMTEAELRTTTTANDTLVLYLHQ